MAPYTLTPINLLTTAIQLTQAYTMAEISLLLRKSEQRALELVTRLNRGRCAHSLLCPGEIGQLGGCLLNLFLPSD